MIDHYDFSEGKRGALMPEAAAEPGKSKLTIQLDDIIDRFFEIADATGGSVGHQTLINSALREYLDGKAPKFEETLRRILREELH